MDKVTAKDLIGVPADFNISNIDVTELEELSKQVSRIENADLNTTEVLSVRFLAGADKCSNLLAQAERWTGYTKALKEKEFSEACFKRSGQESNAAQKAYAGADEQYVRACNVYTTAEAFSEWVKRKYNSLMAAHYVCKEIAKRFRGAEQIGTWGNAPEGAFNR